MLTVELQNKRTALQYAMLGVGAACMLISMTLPPAWALYLGSIGAGVQAFLVCTLVALHLSVKNAPQKRGRGLGGMRSIDGMEEYARSIPDRWENTNEVLKEEP